MNKIMVVEDYLTKPFEAAEFTARVRALLKRYKIASSLAFDIGTLTMHKSSYTIIYGGEKMDIPMKEFELLFELGSYPLKTSQIYLRMGKEYV